MERQGLLRRGEERREERGKEIWVLTLTSRCTIREAWTSRRARRTGKATAAAHPSERGVGVLVIGVIGVVGVVGVIGVVGVVGEWYVLLWWASLVGCRRRDKEGPSMSSMITKSDRWYWKCSRYWVT